MARALKKFDKVLNKSFYWLGQKIAAYTGYFIIIPILISLLFATGLQRLNYEDDPEYLFAPTNGPARLERELIEKNFPMNFSSSFDPSRITRPGRFVRMIVSAKDNGTIMTQEVWDELIRLDNLIKSLKIVHDDEILGYEKSLCAMWGDDCYPNKILELYELVPEILNGSLPLGYPFIMNPYTYEFYPTALFFGGVEEDVENAVATDVKAITLYYWLKSNTSKENIRAHLWEQSVLEVVSDSSFTSIHVSKYTSTTLAHELDINTTSVIPYFAVTVAIMLVFSFVTLLMGDWVRAKPFMGVLGIVSAALACLTAFGLLMYLNVPFIGINLAAPFLMLGIGIDDMFVMLAAWRRTRLQDPLPKRLAETYEEAAVSITITSVTDMISFFIGLITPFPSVQIFCIYTGTAVLLTFIFHITFFGACLAVAGRMEHKQLHVITGKKVKAKSVAEKEESLYYNVWCAGGINESDPWNPKDNKPHLLMVFFRDCIAYLLNIPAIKAFVIALFMVYLAGAVYGCFMVNEGLERRRLSRYDSYSVDYYDLEDMYFREFPYRIQVIISSDLTYTRNNTRNLLLQLHRQLEESPYVADSLYTESWIRAWYDFLEVNQEYLELDPDDEESYLRNIREYLNAEDNAYKLDVEFSDDGKKILFSRFIIQTFRIADSNEDKNMMEELRRICRESPLEVDVFHPHFIFFDQFVLVRTTSIQAICIAAVVMMFICLIFIPNPWSSLWVAFSIISIEVGVVGYMTHWGVNLDSISMINLIMCIGFSVDFSAHISYAYLTAKVNTPEERVRECLFSLGLPILQGAISTILGVLALIAAPSYIFITFFKTVFLVIFFGMMHGIFLLPVLLSLLGPDSVFQKSQSSSNSSSASERPPSNLSFMETGGTELTFSRRRSCGGRRTFPNEADIDSMDRDMGLGTSGEESSESSLSKATGEALKHSNKSRCYRQNSLPAIQQAYTNFAYVSSEEVVVVQEHDPCEKDTTTGMSFSKRFSSGANRAPKSYTWSKSLKENPKKRRPRSSSASFIS